MATVILTTLELSHPESAAPPLTRRGPYRYWVAWLVAVLPFVLLAVWRASSGPGLEADDHAQYLMHAQALAEGRAYNDIPYIYSRYARWIGPKSAMPGVPLVLSVVYRIFGLNLAIMKAVMLCLAFGFVLIAGLYFARHEDRNLGLGVALLCGLSPTIVHGSSQLLTDVPFAALAWGVIYLMDVPGAMSARRIVAITIVGGYALITRTVGLVLIPSMILFAVVRYRDHRWRPLIPVLTWVSGLFLASVLLDVHQASVLRLEPESVLRWFRYTGFGVLNMRWYYQPLVESHLYPFASNRANDVFHLLTASVMMVGIVAWLRRSGSSFGGLFTITYALALLFTPVRQARYAWVLYPVFVFGLLNGMQLLARALLSAPPRARLATRAFAVVLALLGVRAVLATPRPADAMTLPDQVALNQFLEEAAARETVRVSFHKPRSLALATGVPALGPLRGEPECVLGELKRQRISHVIVGAETRPVAQRGLLRNLAETRPDLFSLEHQTGTYAVYRFHAAALVLPRSAENCAR